MRTLPLVALLSALAVSVAAPTTAPDAASLEDELAVAAREAGGVTGVWAVHLPSGRSVALAADTPFPMASVYKLPIALALLSRADEGKLALDESIPVEREDLRRGMGSGITESHRPGMRLTAGELLSAMVTESDNTATDLLLRRLGGPAAVTAHLVARGLRGVRVDRTELQIAGDGTGIAGLPPDGRCTPERFDALKAKVPAAARAAAQTRFQEDPRDTATPRALGGLVVRLFAGELLSPSSTARLVELLRGCRTGEKRLRALLPAGTTVYDKTGTQWRGANDVGAIDLAGGRGRIVAAVLVKGTAKSLADQERAIAHIGRLLHDRLPPAPR